MSNYLTIATVTATLRHVLEEAQPAGGLPDFRVTTQRPDGADARDRQQTARANIYLYQVNSNPAWRNNDLPTRNSNGDVVQRPRAALDLHYLISCYGEEQRLLPQVVLGKIVASLHAQPVLTRKVIEQALRKPEFSDLRVSNLGAEVERVKLTPTPLSLEELSKLWSVFFQTAYTLSVAYQASVVFIDTDDSPMTPLPVREPKVFVMPFRQPVIESVESAQGARAPITPESSLLLRGKQLRGDVTRVRIGGSEQTLDPQNISNEEINLPVPSGLRAGVQSVQLVQPMEMGVPPVAHAGFESNAAPFILHPTIKVAVSDAIGKTKDGTKLFSATITVKFTPKVGRTQRVMLLLNEISESPAEDPRPSYSFPAPKDNGITAPEASDTAAIAFPVTGVARGAYLVRVQVDGAQSQPLSDAKGGYVGPKVTIP